MHVPTQRRLFIGVLSIGALTWLCLVPLEYAPTIAADIEANASAALADYGAENVGVRIDRNPVQRIIHLSGDFPLGEKRRMSQVVVAVPGVEDVIWDEYTEVGER